MTKTTTNHGLMARVNDSVNTAITYTLDDHRDHWQTLSQSMARELGDCDDYACAKFHMLHDAGLVPHLMACYIDGVSHMVCVCDGYVLDNVNTSLLPLDDRTDLSKPVYTLYIDRMECAGKVLPVTNHTKWCDWINRSGLDA